MKKLLLITLTLLSVEVAKANKKEKLEKERDQRIEALNNKVEKIASSLEFKNKLDTCESLNSLLTALYSNAEATRSVCLRAILIRMLPDEDVAIFLALNDSETYNAGREDALKALRNKEEPI